MSIKVLINGANGRMGQETAKTIQHEKKFELVAQTGKNDNLITVIKQTNPDVVIDFTNSAVAFESALAIVNAGVHPVIGTSGLTPEQVMHLQQLCAQQKLGGIIAPNFCIGAVLMMKFAQEAAKYMANVEIIEMHHDGKLDAPSGTAIKTAEMIAEARKNHNENKKIYETIPGSRGALLHQIPIHAVRLPGIVAKQEVIFGSQGATLSLQHATINREAYMPGIVLACEKVLKLDKLIYGLENIL